MTPLEKIRSALVVGGIFGLTLQEGRGQVQFAELLLPGKRLLVCLYSIQETHEDSGYHACSERKEKVRTRFESAGRSSPASACLWPFRDDLDSRSWASTPPLFFRRENIPWPPGAKEKMTVWPKARCALPTPAESES